MPAIGLCGTFDVENFGDLLFPLIAQHELARRFDAPRLQCFSYRQRQPPQWPFSVTSMAAFGDALEQLQCLLIGGGHIVRFDKSVAPGYFPPTAQLHHPLALWLTPALLALAQGVPVAWNAPAVYGPVPLWAKPMTVAAIEASDYVCVRDEASQRELAVLAPDVAVECVPDTVFGIADLIDTKQPSAACAALRASIGLHEPYLIVQATSGMDALVQAVCAVLAERYRVLLLPIGPALGDAEDALAHVPHALTLPHWPHPLLIAELIAGAAGVVGPSLHLAICALACGVPVFRPMCVDDGKYELLQRFERVHGVTQGAQLSADWLHSRLGRGTPEPRTSAAHAQLARHWDRVAQVAVLPRRRSAAPAIRALWQRLPMDLEGGARQAVRLDQAQGAIDALRAENEALRNSLSWRVTAPLRRALGALRRESHGRDETAPAAASAATRVQPVLRFGAITRTRLAREPYAWASVDHLFLPQDAAELVATFPRDHFKTVEGYDGEKGYAYHARALIDMGSADIAQAHTLSPAWRRLAADLLSPHYRAALSKLTGVDLSALCMEANVFHYGPGAWLGPHLDLKDKIVTHVLYFNAEWDPALGGCLHVLRSSDMNDAAGVVAPVAGTSAVLVRSENSWHAVSRVDASCTQSRRSVTVTFYRAGAVSTMWPPSDATPTSDYVEAHAY